MNEKEIIKWLRISGVILIALLFAVGGLYFGGVLSMFQYGYFIYIGMSIGFPLCWAIIGILIYFLKGRIKAKTLFVEFFCPKCEEYVSSPRNRPNCPNCNTVMYPVRYCPYCRQSDPVVSLTQWKCYRCGHKLKEIINIVSMEQGLDKQTV